ncbi:hypothetical protein QBC40DRAFT_276861 [Triangularia verruculosa]|uniref:Uncharacterized protein n=1 Tax=Triangularia verruculosa TaxID=2587418 RepID=A0AAN6XK48_9PEZI|nr:hypothetical protein QBC40DRAFT_276861 [Triangularia verruculosa]
MSSERRNSLSPPERRGTVDPGARDLAESDSEEHYSDAQSGPVGSAPASPIPRTRVERVDDKPAYGEVPGTEAYSKREGDAEPDEIAIIPDPLDPTPPEPERYARSPTPGGHPIPKTVVEEAPDTEGSVTHPEVEERHKSDPNPDVTIKADGKRVEDHDAPISPSQSTPVSTRSRRKSSNASRRPAPLSPTSPGPPGGGDDAVEGDDDEDNGDDFGDDFDDFEEGGNDDLDDDFGDFDDGFQQVEDTPAPPPAAVPAPTPAPAAASALSFPIPTFDDLDSSEIASLTEPYLSALFPPADAINPLPSLSNENPIFLTPRSASLWSQLVAPPPLQPPDWIRSRIRRLFLVSLGVPVDLDEILPASKQKKLVLPTLHRTTSNGSFQSADSRSVSRVRNSSAVRTSVDSQGNLKPPPPRSSSSKKPSSSEIGSSSSTTTAAAAAAKDNNSPEKSLDLLKARQLCMTTDEAMNGMTDAELRGHVGKLERMQFAAKDVLDYWQKRTDEKIGDREAFEKVIENLVKHARKARK